MIKKLLKSQLQNIYLDYGFLLVCLIPFSFLLGTFFVNLNVILITIYFLINFKKFNLKDFLKEKEIIFFILFFSTICLSSLLNQSNFVKSLLYLRFLIFILAINFIFLKIDRPKIEILKKFIFISFLTVIISIIIEFLLLKLDVIWPNSSEFYRGKRYSGIFFSEYIAGWYLFIFGSLLWIFSFSKQYNFKLYSLLFVIFFGIILSGSRSSLLSFLFFAFVGVIIKEIRFYNIKFIFTILIITFVSFKTNLIPERYTTEIYSYIYSQDLYNKEITEEENKKTDFFQRFKNTQWGAHYLTSFEMFKLKKFLGHGIKSFREECSNSKYEKIKSENYNIRCSTHPHLVFLELLSEGGIFTTFFFYLANILILFKAYKLRHSDNRIFLITIVALSLIIPFKPSGSIFTTNYATAYWFLISLIIYLIQNLKKL